MFDIHQSAIARGVAVGEPRWETRAAAVGLAALMTVKTASNSVETRTRMFRDGYLFTHPSMTGVNGALYMQAADHYRYAIGTGAYIGAYNRADAAMRAGDIPRALLAVASMPGMGLAKGGFALTMIWGVAGCIDSENSALHGVRAPRSVCRLSDAGAYRAAERYLAVIAACGGTGALWDSWCEHIAGKAINQPRWHGDADAVSREHIRWVDNVRAGLGA